MEYITIDANVLCTNSKIVSASIYDWVAEVITDQGKYAIQLSNIKDTSYFNFSNVIYLNQNQSEIVLLNGKIPVKAMMLVDKYRGINKVTKIDKMTIMYRYNGGKKRKKCRIILRDPAV